MPGRSPRPMAGSQRPGSEFFPANDFLESSSLPTELTEIADGDIHVMEVLAELDPDQVAPADVVKKRLGFTFWLSSAWFALVAVLAVLAPVLPIPDYKKTGIPRLPPFTSGHLLGTDTLGRDILSRLIWGARVSLVVGFAAILLGIVIGGTIGILAGFFRGRAETLLMGAMDVLLAFPALLLALAIVTFTQSKSVLVVTIAIGIVSIPPISRLVRASTLVNTEREYVMASRALGASRLRTITREVLPNVILPVLSFSIIGIAVAIVAEGGLAFLGLSVAPPTPTWGGMINDGRTALETDPFICLIPCLVMFLTVLSLNLAGDRIREYLDVKEGGL